MKQNLSTKNFTSVILSLFLNTIVLLLLLLLVSSSLLDDDVVVFVSAEQRIWVEVNVTQKGQVLVIDQSLTNQYEGYLIFFEANDTTVIVENLVAETIQVRTNNVDNETSDNLTLIVRNVKCKITSTSLAVTECLKVSAARDDGVAHGFRARFGRIEIDRLSWHVNHEEMDFYQKFVETRYLVYIEKLDNPNSDEAVGATSIPLTSSSSSTSSHKNLPLLDTKSLQESPRRLLIVRNCNFSFDWHVGQQFSDVVGLLYLTSAEDLSRLPQEYSMTLQQFHLVVENNVFAPVHTKSNRTIGSSPGNGVPIVMNHLLYSKITFSNTNFSLVSNLVFFSEKGYTCDPKSLPSSSPRVSQACRTVYFHVFYFLRVSDFSTGFSTDFSLHGGVFVLNATLLLPLFHVESNSIQEAGLAVLPLQVQYSFRGVRFSRSSRIVIDGLSLAPSLTIDHQVPASSLTSVVESLQVGGVRFEDDIIYFKQVQVTNVDLGLVYVRDLSKRRALILFFLSNQPASSRVNLHTIMNFTLAHCRLRLLTGAKRWELQSGSYVFDYAAKSKILIHAHHSNAEVRRYGVVQINYNNLSIRSAAPGDQQEDSSSSSSLETLLPSFPASEFSSHIESRIGFFIAFFPLYQLERCSVNCVPDPSDKSVLYPNSLSVSNIDFFFPQMDCRGIEDDDSTAFPSQFTVVLLRSKSAGIKILGDILVSNISVRVSFSSLEVASAARNSYIRILDITPNAGTKNFVRKMLHLWNISLNASFVGVCGEISVFHLGQINGDAVQITTFGEGVLIEQVMMDAKQLQCNIRNWPKILLPDIGAQQFIANSVFSGGRTAAIRTVTSPRSLPWPEVPTPTPFFIIRDINISSDIVAGAPAPPSSVTQRVTIQATLLRACSHLDLDRKLEISNINFHRNYIHNSQSGTVSAGLFLWYYLGLPSAETKLEFSSCLVFITNIFFQVEIADSATSVVPNVQDKQPGVLVAFFSFGSADFGNTGKFITQNLRGFVVANSTLISNIKSTKVEERMHVRVSIADFADMLHLDTANLLKYPPPRLAPASPTSYATASVTDGTLAPPSSSEIYSAFSSEKFSQLPDNFSSTSSYPGVLFSNLTIVANHETFCSTGAVVLMMSKSSIAIGSLPVRFDNINVLAKFARVYADPLPGGLRSAVQEFLTVIASVLRSDAAVAVNAPIQMRNINFRLATNSPVITANVLFSQIFTDVGPRSPTDDATFFLNLSLLVRRTSSVSSFTNTNLFGPTYPVPSSPSYKTPSSPNDNNNNNSNSKTKDQLFFDAFLELASSFQKLPATSDPAFKLIYPWHSATTSATSAFNIVDCFNIAKLDAKPFYVMDCTVDVSVDFTFSSRDSEISLVHVRNMLGSTYASMPNGPTRQTKVGHGIVIRDCTVVAHYATANHLNVALLRTQGIVSKLAFLSIDQGNVLRANLVSKQNLVCRSVQLGSSSFPGSGYDLLLINVSNIVVTTNFESLAKTSFSTHFDIFYTHFGINEQLSGVTADQTNREQRVIQIDNNSATVFYQAVGSYGTPYITISKITKELFVASHFFSCSFNSLTIVSWLYHGAAGETLDAVINEFGTLSRRSLSDDPEVPPSIPNYDSENFFRTSSNSLRAFSASTNMDDAVKESSGVEDLGILNALVGLSSFERVLCDQNEISWRNLLTLSSSSSASSASASSSSASSWTLSNPTFPFTSSQFLSLSLFDESTRQVYAPKQSMTRSFVIQFATRYAIGISGPFSLQNNSISILDLGDAESKNNSIGLAIWPGSSLDQGSRELQMKHNSILVTRCCSFFSSSSSSSFSIPPPSTSFTNHFHPLRLSVIMSSFPRGNFFTNSYLVNNSIQVKVHDASSSSSSLPLPSSSFAQELRVVLSAITFSDFYFTGEKFVPSASFPCPNLLLVSHNKIEVQTFSVFPSSFSSSSSLPVKMLIQLYSSSSRFFGRGSILNNIIHVESNLTTSESLERNESSQFAEFFTLVSPDSSSEVKSALSTLLPSSQQQQQQQPEEEKVILYSAPKLICLFEIMKINVVYATPSCYDETAKLPLLIQGNNISLTVPSSSSSSSSTRNNTTNSSLSRFAQALVTLPEKSRLAKIGTSILKVSSDARLQSSKKIEIISNTQNGGGDGLFYESTVIAVGATDAVGNCSFSISNHSFGDTKNSHSSSSIFVPWEKTSTSLLRTFLDENFFDSSVFTSWNSDRKNTSTLAKFLNDAQNTSWFFSCKEKLQQQQQGNSKNLSFQFSDALLLFQRQFGTTFFILEAETCGISKSTSAGQSLSLSQSGATSSRERSLSTPTHNQTETHSDELTRDTKEITTSPSRKTDSISSSFSEELVKQKRTFKSFVPAGASAAALTAASLANSAGSMLSMKRSRRMLSLTTCGGGGAGDEEGLDSPASPPASSSNKQEEISHEFDHIELDTLDWIDNPLFISIPASPSTSEHLREPLASFLGAAVGNLSLICGVLLLVYLIALARTKMLNKERAEFNSKVLEEQKIHRQLQGEEDDDDDDDKNNKKNKKKKSKSKRNLKRPLGVSKALLDFNFPSVIAALIKILGATSLHVGTTILILESFNSRSMMLAGINFIVFFCVMVIGFIRVYLKFHSGEIKLDVKKTDSNVNDASNVAFPASASALLASSPSASSSAGAQNSDSEDSDAESTSSSSTGSTSPGICSRLKEAISYITDPFLNFFFKPRAEWVDSHYLQRWGGFFEMAETPLWPFCDFAVAALTEIIGTAGTFTCPAKGPCCIAIASVCTFLALVHTMFLVLRRPPLNKWDTMCDAIASTSTLVVASLQTAAQVQRMSIRDMTAAAAANNNNPSSDSSSSYSPDKIDSALEHFETVFFALAIWDLFTFVVAFVGIAVTFFVQASKFFKRIRAKIHKYFKERDEKKKKEEEKEERRLRRMQRGYDDDEDEDEEEEESSKRRSKKKKKKKSNRENESKRSVRNQKNRNRNHGDDHDESESEDDDDGRDESHLVPSAIVSSSSSPSSARERYRDEGEDDKESADLLQSNNVNTKRKKEQQQEEQQQEQKKKKKKTRAQLEREAEEGPEDYSILYQFNDEQQQDGEVGEEMKTHPNFSASSSSSSSAPKNLLNLVGEERKNNSVGGEEDAELLGIINNNNKSEKKVKKKQGVTDLI